MLVDKIIQLDRSKRRVLLGALVVFAAIALYRYILSPYGNQLMAAQRYKTTLDEAIHKSKSLDTILKAKKEKVQKLSEQFNQKREELFTPVETQKFFGSVQTIARNAGCLVQSVSSIQDSRLGQQTEQDASGITGKKAVIDVVGGFGNIEKFMKELQSYQHKIWIESFKMDTGNAGKLKCQVTLTLYCIEHLEATFYE
jgi:Tfp pilus assembly protein PilO